MASDKATHMLASYENGWSLRNRKVTILAYLSWGTVRQHHSARLQLASRLSNSLTNFLTHSG